MLTISTGKITISYISLWTAAGYLLLILWLVPGYLQWNANVYAGLLLSPFICTIKQGEYSWRYLLPALLTITAAAFMPVRTTFFLAVLFTALFFIENHFGKLNDAFLFLMILISPVFKYMTSLVDFPVRLWISEQVAGLLSSAGINAAAAGNQIEMNDVVFSVDPACAGLHMLILSLIICLFLLMHHQRKTERQLQFLSLVCVFMLTIGLNLVCNFFRILLLVTFKIMPGTLLHDLIGIVCLTIYVIVPLMIGLKPILKQFGTRKATERLVSNSSDKHLRQPWLHSSLLIVILCIAFHLSQADTFIQKPSEINLYGFRKRKLENGVLKFENKEALIYIKPTAFYAPEHDPKVCWAGSGYVFKSIKKERWQTFELYTAVLEKGKDKIYAAWWFDNGKTQTVDQLRWRWKGIKGEKRFYLINVNAVSQDILQKQVGRLLADQLYLN